MPRDLTHVPALHPSACVTQPPPYRPDGTNAPASAQALGREVARVNYPLAAPHPHSEVRPVPQYIVPATPRIDALRYRIPIKRTGASPQLFRFPLCPPDGEVGWALSYLSTPGAYKGNKHPGTVGGMGPKLGKPLEYGELTITGTSIPLATYNEEPILRALFSASVTAPVTAKRMITVGPGFTLPVAVAAIVKVQNEWCDEVTCGDSTVSRTLAHYRFRILQESTYIVALCGETGVDGKRVMYPELELMIPEWALSALVRR